GPAVVEDVGELLLRGRIDRLAGGGRRIHVHEFLAGELFLDRVDGAVAIGGAFRRRGTGGEAALHAALMAVVEQVRRDGTGPERRAPGTGRPGGGREPRRHDQPRRATQPRMEAPGTHDWANGLRHLLGRLRRQRLRLPRLYRLRLDRRMDLAA